MRKHKRKKYKELSKYNRKVSDIKLKGMKNLDCERNKYEENFLFGLEVPKLSEEEMEEALKELLKEDFSKSKRRFRRSKKRLRKNKRIVSSKENSILYMTLYVKKCSKMSARFITVKANDDKIKNIPQINADERDGKGTITGSN